tara:strand:+ start:326 stop:724 length:399 start_codon:yes stop_codon:yes gene_type:complete
MSHFSQIKTQLKCKESLVSALNTLGHDVEHDVELEVRGGHAEGHPKFNACVAIASDIGFSWCDRNEHYRLIAEEDTWDLDVPVQRFIDRLTQQYAIEKIKRKTAEQGYNVEIEQKNRVDGSVDLVVSRWIYK